MKKYAILINTCDKFEDCWQPYFTLHAKFWQDCTGKLYLNTETKDFQYAGLNIWPLKVAVGQGGRRLTWSECLLRALDEIQEDVVLYMQEDYFLKAPVKNEWVERFVDLMKGDESIHCIHLTDQSVVSQGLSQYVHLHQVKRKQRYRICCQAALWRKDVLKSYLRTYESAWQFEEFGSKRAAIIPHNFFVVDSAWVKLNQFEIIPYIFTGIIQGRWKKEVEPLFSANNITVNYTLRGFLEDVPTRKWIDRFKSFGGKLPIILRNYISILNPT